jgi:hypothetical protein
MKLLDDIVDLLSDGKGSLTEALCFVARQCNDSYSIGDAFDVEAGSGAREIN